MTDSMTGATMLRILNARQRWMHRGDLVRHATNADPARIYDQLDDHDILDEMIATGELVHEPGQGGRRSSVGLPAWLEPADVGAGA